MQDLFVHTLGDIYYAENQILKALPKMAEKAQSEELREAFEQHLEETREQIQRLEKVFGMCNAPVKGERCDAIEGILKEADGLINEIEDLEVRDAGMLAAAQAVEHYEISRYGTLIAWAEELEMDDAIDLLEQTLDEEKNADRLLTEIAEGGRERERCIRTSIPHHQCGKGRDGETAGPFLFVDAKPRDKAPTAGTGRHAPSCGPEAPKAHETRSKSDENPMSAFAALAILAAPAAAQTAPAPRAR